MSDQPARILLVDDERLLLLAMVRYLHLGRPAWEVLTALDGGQEQLGVLGAAFAPLSLASS